MNFKVLYMFNGKYKPAISIAARIWIVTSLAFGILWVIASIVTKEIEILKLSILATIVSGIASIPVCIALIFIIPFIKKINRNFKTRIAALMGVCFVVSVCYAILGVYITGGFTIFRADIPDDYVNSLWIECIKTFAIYTAILFTCSGIAVLLNIKAICNYFNAKTVNDFNNTIQKKSPLQININMDTTINSQNTSPSNENSAGVSSSNKILIK